MSAPASIIRAVTVVLAEQRVSFSVVGSWNQRKANGREKVLLVGKNALVGEAFRFEEAVDTQ